MWIGNTNSLLSRRRKYTTIYNGAHPFEVIFDGITMKIYDTTTSNEVETLTNFEGYFVGEDTAASNSETRKKHKGNSLLVKVKEDEYIFIGECIYSFKTREEIKNFYSPVGNSAVPYPFAISESKVFLLAEKQVIEKSFFHEEIFENGDEVYSYFYGLTRKNKNVPAKKMKSKILVPRNF